MTSHNSSSASNYSMSSSGREEARRKHFLSLHKRRRFQAKYNVEEVAENGCSNNNATFGNEELSPGDVMSHSSFPVDRNVGAMPLPALHSDPSICNIPCRSFSSATYQPVYPQHYNATLCYPPVPQNVCQHVSQRLRSMELRNNVDIPDISEVDDDDVFVPSGTRILPNPGVVLPLPTAIPCSPTTLQMMQSRKRAHSAGDMVGLYSPTVARLLYPNTGHTAIPSQNFNPPTVNGSHSFAHNGPSGPTLPRKWLITDQPTPSKFDQIYQPPVNITKSNSIVTPTNPRLSNGIINIKPQIAPNSTNRSMPVSDPRKSAAVRNHSSIKEPVSTPTKLRKLPPKSQPRATVKADGLPQTSSALKSSLSSKPSSMKKKVGWNDLAHKRKVSPAKTKSLSTDRMSLQCKELDVELIKSNPSAFTTENRIGPYLIGPKLGNCPVKSISQYLVRKCNSSKYYMAKILQMDEDEVSSGKMLLHTENSLLSLLASHSGVIRQHGLFKDCYLDAKSGKIFPRVGLILDCLTPHEYDDESLNYLNLQQYVIQLKRLSEHEAIRIFYSILSIVYSLHKCNVVHRDLKLGNMVLDKRTRRVILTNFCLGCHLTSDHNLLTDQRGSPAYISPDVLSDKPYAGKPSDMWSLGVILYTMLYGQFPFYDQEPKKLFAKIKAADYTIPTSGQVSSNTNDIIRGLLTLDPSSRFTARDALLAVEASAASWNAIRSSAALQVVPDIDVPEPFKSSWTHADLAMSEEELTIAFQRKMLSEGER